MAFDYKKEYKEFYMPKNKPSIVEIPKMNFIAVRGTGNPNEENGDYQNTIGLLYGVAYAIKMSYKGTHKIDGFFEYVVSPLEGFWWQDGIEGTDGGVYLTKSQVKEIADSNLVSIGSHTKTHPALTDLNSEQLDYELRESKKGLEKLIGKEVKTICYPTGAYNKKVLEYIPKYYDYGLAIENGVQKMYDDYNKLTIKRFRVYRNTSFSKFKSMVDQAN